MLEKHLSSIFTTVFVILKALQMDTTAKEKPANKFIAKAKRSLGDIFNRVSTTGRAQLHG